MESDRSDRIRVATILAVLTLVFLLVLIVLKLPLANVIWMKQGEVVRLLNYHNNSNISLVQLIDVGGESNRTKLCGFSVDGDQTWIEEGRNRELNGVKIYVREAIIGRGYLEDQDYCKVTFTKPIVMYNGSEILETPENVLEEQETSPINYTNVTPVYTPVSQPGPQNISPNAEIHATEEKPTRMSILEIIILWLSDLFTF